MCTQTSLDTTFKYCAVQKQDVHWGEESIHFSIIRARSTRKQQEDIFLFNIVLAWKVQGIVVAEHNAFRQNLKNLVHDLELLPWKNMNKI